MAELERYQSKYHGSHLSGHARALERPTPFYAERLIRDTSDSGFSYDNPRNDSQLQGAPGNIACISVIGLEPWRDLMGLRDKYSYAIAQAKGKFDGSAQERDGKLHFVGTVKTEEDKNQLWNAIKTIPDWQKEIVADIKVVGGPAAAPQTSQTYTVKAGDTLSAIAKQHLGNANAYMKIFEANRDQLTDPDKIRPGQVLRIPAA
jgi:LysM repeat protein